MQCLHPSWGFCHYRRKGTTPGFKGDGYFRKCTACPTYVPC